MIQHGPVSTEANKNLTNNDEEKARGNTIKIAPMN